MKVRKIYKQVLALIAIPFILSGCEKADCNVPTRHVHLYTKKVNNLTIKNYLNKEDLTYYDYNWNNDYIEVTNDDLEFYKVKGALFDGYDNWDYLYRVMASKKDYLEFYYHYTEDGVMTMIDADGNAYSMPYTDTYEGWSKDPKHRGVTGKTRVVHHRFYGYRIIKKDGKYELEKSKSVDDIRTIINDYPYYKEDCVTKVNKEYQFDKKNLSSIKLEDIDEFTGPDLESSQIKK